MYRSTHAGTTRKYYEHKTISSDRNFECSVAAYESMAPVIKLVSTEYGTWLIFKVKILFWIPRIWRSGYLLLTSGDKCQQALQCRRGQKYDIFVVQIADLVRKRFSLHACSPWAQFRVGLNKKQAFHFEERGSWSYIKAVRRKDCYPPCRVWEHIASIGLVFDQQPRYFFLVVRSYEQHISFVRKKYNFLLENLSIRLPGRVGQDVLTILKSQTFLIMFQCFLAFTLRSILFELDEQKVWSTLKDASNMSKREAETR